jgi:formylmethanofuran dehydrogenase subunit E
MCSEISNWDKVIEFHGHSCPGVAIGYQAARVALQRLQTMRAGDEELVAIVENDACGVDAIQVLTGCTFGKGKAFHEHQQERIRYILDLPDDEFCEIREVKIEFPAKASIYDSYNCSECGEQVMEPRARIKGGRIVCLPCSER